MLVAWGSPTIQRIVVGIRTNLTQQVSTGPREGGHSTTRGVLTSLEASIFLFDLSIMEKETQAKKEIKKISYSDFLSSKQDIISVLNNIFGY